MPTVEHITFMKCPVCGAKIHSVTVCDQHTNGYWNERVEFRCDAFSGSVYEYSPNFNSVKLAKPCPKAHELFLKMAGINVGKLGSES